MSEKLAIDKRTPIDDQTMALIAKRVAEYKKSEDNSKQSDDEIKTHINALSEVFELDKEDVKQIVKEVLIQKEQQLTVKEKLYDGIIKYSKEAIISVLVVMLITFLLLGRFSLQEPRFVKPDVSLTSSNYFRGKVKLSHVLVMITPIKLMLTEYYMDQGVFPSSLKSIGLDRNEMKTGQGIDDLMIIEGGGILVKLNASIGDRLILILSPKITLGGMNFEWQCETNISGYIRDCKKIKGEQYLEKFH
ncbi:MAG: hypothetical protein KAG28_02830 [Cocleimonas sp.]|nr:hypothetical protein [Cocleimonas sp.]